MLCQLFFGGGRLFKKGDGDVTIGWQWTKRSSGARGWCPGEEAGDRRGPREEGRGLSGRIWSRCYLSMYCPLFWVGRVRNGAVIANVRVNLT